MNFFFRITKMLCYCKDNVEASFVLGIILVFLNLLSFLGLIIWQWPWQYILLGIFGALVSGVLMFGAKKRNHTAILIWMVFAIIGVVCLTVVIGFCLLYFMVPADVKSHGGNIATVYLILVTGALLSFEIWAIIVAKRARDEMKGEGIEAVVFNQA